ncbi:hypothetical protein Gasu2_27160 [Galdieria sulphuraria]|nr:hypothetical protein Gasu2_27160 [Galdieria sulphuraria]
MATFVLSKDRFFPKQKAYKFALRRNCICYHRKSRRITSLTPLFKADLQQQFGLNVRSIWKSLQKQGHDAQTEDMKKQKRNILVVGATGRVGRLVCKNLSSRVKYGYRIWGLSRSPTSVKEAELPKEVNLTFRDLQESNSLESFVGKVDGVIWTAGSRGPPGFGTGGPREIDHLALKNMVQLFAESWKSEQRERTVYDFSLPDMEHIFQPVQQSSIEVSNSSSFRYSTGFGIFTGNLMKYGDGNVAQIRAQSTVPLNLSEFDGFCLKVKGDGRRYRIFLKDNEVDTSEEYSFQYFIPVKNSKILFGEGANLYKYRLNKSSIHMIGFGISRLDLGGLVDPNFRTGRFELVLEKITAFSLTIPRLVVLSSAAVTRLEWNEKQRQIYAGSFNIPIVQLNPGNILNEKRMGEDAVRSSGIPYCIIRATGLNDEHPSGRIVFQQGDTAVGRINLTKPLKYFRFLVKEKYGKNVLKVYS